MNPCTLFKDVLLNFPLALSSIMLLLAAAFFGGVVIWIWMQHRWHIGIYLQQRQEEKDKMFRRQQ